MKVGLFYQIWHEHQKAAYESLKQLRITYPETEIAVLVTGLPKANLEHYENTYIATIKETFNITKVEYLYKEDFLGHFHAEVTQENILDYNDILLEKTLYMLDDSTDFVIYCSEDLYVFKQVPINPDYDVCCNLRPYDDWMNKEMQNRFDYSKYSGTAWFQHGHYLNSNKFKKVFTAENREYVKKVIKELYPNRRNIYSDYFTSIWCILACDTFGSAQNYFLELPSGITEETPLETFNRTGCHVRHGYKVLYHQTL